MKHTQKDYTKLNLIANKLGFVQYIFKKEIKEGFYTLKGLDAPIDLTACGEDEISILKTAVRQLSNA